MTSEWQRQGPAEATLINERSTVERLWARKLPTGEEVSATLWWNNSIGAVVELEVHASFAENTIAEALAADVLAMLDAKGAKPFEPDEATRTEVVDRILKEIE
jgi:hypothetical protein